MQPLPTWQETLFLHTSAVQEFTGAALKIPGDSWSHAAGAHWTPAHLTEHLLLVYEVLLSELGGGPGMKIRTNAFVRPFLRWYFVPRLLRGNFPKKAPAPQEVRPTLTRTIDQVAAVETFQQLAEKFHQHIREIHARDPQRRLTHAYFGTATLHQAFLLCVRHLEHHTKQLRGC